MATLRDALTEAFDAVPDNNTASSEAVSVSEPSPVGDAVEAAVEKVERARDEAGRFASKTEKTEEPAEVAADLPTPKKAPSSWKKDYWSAWDKLASDPELSKLQDYIEQREGEFATGVSTYRTEAMKAKALQDAIAPFVPDMQKYGVQPEVEIRNLLNAHHTLVSADPQQKLQMFAKLATDYGVPLQALGGGQYDPQSAQLMTEMNALKSQFGQIYQSQQQREAAEVAQKIEQFKAGREHFEALKESMAGLLQAGIASDLETAYDKALRLNDDLWKAEQAKQAQAAEKERLAKLAEKKATAVSPRSSSPTATRGKASGGNDLRSLLGAAFEQHANGRL